MPHLRPQQFGENSTRWHDGFFRFRIGTTESVEHLRAAASAEAERRARRERIAVINQQLAEAET